MRFVPRVRTSIVREWMPHPISEAYSAAIGTLYGRGINGSRGTIATQASRRSAGAVADPAVGWAGNTAPPQLFTGWTAKNQQGAGVIITTPGGLPGTALPLGSGSPLDSAMAQIMQGSA